MALFRITLNPRGSNPLRHPPVHDLDAERAVVRVVVHAQPGQAPAGEPTADDRFELTVSLWGRRGRWGRADPQAPLEWRQLRGVSLAMTGRPAPPDPRGWRDTLELLDPGDQDADDAVGGLWWCGWCMEGTEGWGTAKKGTETRFDTLEAAAEHAAEHWRAFIAWVFGQGRLAAERNITTALKRGEPASRYEILAAHYGIDLAELAAGATTEV